MPEELKIYIQSIERLFDKVFRFERIDESFVPEHSDIEYQELTQKTRKIVDPFETHGKDFTYNAALNEWYFNLMNEITKKMNGNRKKTWNMFWRLTPEIKVIKDFTSNDTYYQVTSRIGIWSEDA